MSLSKNIGTEDGDNVGACIARLANEVIMMRDAFFLHYGITKKEAKKDIKKYQKLWEEWVKEHKYID